MTIKMGYLKLPRYYTPDIQRAVSFLMHSHTYLSLHPCVSSTRATSEIFCGAFSHSHVCQVRQVASLCQCGPCNSLVRRQFQNVQKKVKAKKSQWSGVANSDGVWVSAHVRAGLSMRIRGQRHGDTLWTVEDFPEKYQQPSGWNARQNAENRMNSYWKFAQFRLMSTFYS